MRYEELDPVDFEHGLCALLGPVAAAGVAGVYHYMASGADPLLMAGDDGVSAEVLALEPAPVEEWVSRRPWQVWSTDAEEPDTPSRR
ncbi:hypothetical protein ACWFR1_13930 [Streptomyces sp. NPDC055103]